MKNWIDMGNSFMNFKSLDIELDEDDEDISDELDENNQFKLTSFFLILRINLI